MLPRRRDWLRRTLGAAAAALGCHAAHGLLQAHYVEYCRGSWLALFAVDPSPYCALVRRALGAVQAAPLAVLLGAGAGAEGLGALAG